MNYPYSLFSCFGVELEYMIVDRATLDVRPICDKVMADVAGGPVSDVDRDGVSWSNELVLHVIELKTNGPAATLDGLADAFQRDINEINGLLLRRDARLMPTAMHPWMDPHRETMLWPHEYTAVYHAFDRIFGCQGHGWSNLQSTHLNLPFANDDEFGRLHAAIRLVLPLLPGLAASSPIVDSATTGLLDNRLEAYRRNATKIPRVTALVVPEPVYSHADYDAQILQPLYADIAPLDPEGVLQHEFLNARGAIARFERGAIEIRVLDIQECPQADLAMLSLIIAALKALAEERWCDLATPQRWPTEPLADLLVAAIRDADQTPVRDADYLRLFGIAGSAPRTIGDVWRHLADTLLPRDATPAAVREPLDVILNEGPLARRMLARLNGRADLESLHDLFSELCDCLAAGRMLRAAD